MSPIASESLVAEPAPERSPIVRTALLLVPFQIVRAGEPLLPVLLAAWFGSTAATDVYYLALAYFTFVGSLSFGIFRDSVLVPMLAEVRLNTPDQVAKVAGSFLAHTLVFGTALAGGVGVLALGLGAIHFRDTKSSFVLGATMVLPFCLYLVALSVKTFFGALLNAQYRFFAPPVASGLGVATTIGTIALFRSRLGIAAVPMGSLAGELVGIGVLGYVAIGLLKMKFELSLVRPEPVRRFIALAWPDVAGGAITRINPMVDQAMIVLTGVVGGGTLLKQAGDLADFPTSILQAALLPVLLTHLSDDYASGNRRKFRSTIVKSLASVCGILTAASLLLYSVRGPLLRLVFLHGEMNSAAVERMAELLPYGLVGLPPFGALLVLARAHIAIKNTRLMLPMGMANAILHILFNAAFVRFIGLGGLALSSSCVNIVIAVAFWIQLEARLGDSALGRGRAPAALAREPSH